VLCSAACRAISCGDGIAEGPEQCDDGNADDRDACTSDCQFTCPSGGVPAAKDRCDVGMDDANCNGTPNDACECVGVERTTCGELYAAKGDCAAMSLGCTAMGAWPAASSCSSTLGERCNNDGRDEDCDGQVNEDCDCLLGETASCEQLYDSLGDCASKLLGCTANGTWPPASSCAATAGQNCSAPTPGAGGSANTGGGAGGGP
jgi:cysteine-rich repeat protein